MTDPTRTPAPYPVAHVALSTNSVAGAASYVDARCPTCSRLVMAVPAPATVEARAVKNNAARSGRGSCVKCPRCSTLVEVIRHG